MPNNRLRLKYNPHGHFNYKEVHFLRVYCQNYMNQDFATLYETDQSFPKFLSYKAFICRGITSLTLTKLKSY